jgi:hypothetical protein
VQCLFGGIEQDTARVPLEYCPTQHLHEIPHRATGPEQNAGLPSRRLSRHSGQNSRLASDLLNGNYFAGAGLRRRNVRRLYRWASSPIGPLFRGEPTHR